MPASVVRVDLEAPERLEYLSRLIGTCHPGFSCCSRLTNPLGTNKPTREIQTQTGETSPRRSTSLRVRKLSVLDRAHHASAFVKALVILVADVKNAVGHH